MTALLLHGFMGAPTAWREVALRAGVRAIAPWLPGHGPTPATSARTFDDAVDELAPAAGPHTLVGYSMGARVALRLLLRHPRRFTRAVLVGAHPGLSDPAPRAAWESTLRASLLPGTRSGVPTPQDPDASGGNRAFRPDPVPPAFVDAWETLPVLRPVRRVPADRLARRRAWRLEHTAHGLAHALDVLGLAAMPDTWSALAGIEVPVTLVAGAGDTKFATVAHAMADALPNATVALVPRCGHDVTLEAPDELARLIRAAEETT